MNYSPMLDRLSGLGGAKWEVHSRALQMARAGRDVIDLTIGNPDVPVSPKLVDAAVSALRAGRIQYSDGRGEAALREALAGRYTRRSGRDVHPDQVLCFPGTQTALFAVMMGIGQEGAEILVGDPMYATYEGVIAASGSRLVPVPLRAENGFRISAGDLAARITGKSRAILLNTPHNPTGSVLAPQDIAEIGALARKHGLWLIVDEVYEELVFDGVTFTSPFDRADLADRTIVVASISKSHAAPGFRSGWCVGPVDFTERLLPFSEVMLFGNQPFIADMTAMAVAAPSEAAAGMRRRFAARAARLGEAFAGHGKLRVHLPEAGMFALIDISATGMDDRSFALDLLDREGVALMPGSVFGEALGGWLRVALTADDARLAEATARILGHVSNLAPKGVSA